MFDPPVTITAAFLIGLVSTVHCVGMCGSIMGAMSLSLPAPVRESQWRRLHFVTAYNIGRISSYSLAGLLAGSIGQGLFQETLSSGHMLLQLFGMSIMIAIGLYLAGWLPQLAFVEKAGVPVWNKLEPIGRRLMPVDSSLKALGYGMIWGWLPCGLVYTVLIWTLTTGDALLGALTMFAFGLGTMPTLIAAGFMASGMMRLARSPVTRRIIGVLIILMAGAAIVMQTSGSHDHHQHEDHSQHHHHMHH